MIRSFRAELARLTRRRILLGTALAGLIFAVGGVLLVLGAAKPAGQGGNSLIPTTQLLETSSGGNEVFRHAAAFTGTFVFVVMVGLIAAEFARGTVRTMLLRQPRRVQLLGGKILAMLAYAAVTLVVVEIVMWVVARILAPAFDISAGSWASVAGITSGLKDFGIVFVWVAGYTVFGATVALLLRSVPLSLAVGIAWAGPIEHLLGDAWTPGQRFFPGLLLEQLAAGGNAEVSDSRALIMTLIYIVVAGAICSVVFSRRDVTA
ncbi:MAG TPA: hypothetical protein VHC49_14150 [Mycobacteriales bacterium]|nr:hypothetical protein [Mycobacteriales bacterium]